MPRPLIPPRGAFVSSAVIYDESLSDTMKATYMQLLGLAYGKSETPSLSFQQLSKITNKAIGTLYKHMGALRDRGVLRWRTAQDRTIIVSFPKGASKGQAFFTDEENSNSRNREKPVKEEEGTNTSRRKENYLPPLPPVNPEISQKNVEAQPFQAETRQLLLKAGVYASKLAKLEKTGLEDDHIVAIVRQTQDEFPGENKGALICYRIENAFLPEKKYFAKPCVECGKFGDHTSSCSHHPYAQYLSTSIEEDEAEAELFENDEIFTPVDPKITHAWTTVLSQLREEMPRASYDTWVSDTKALSFTKGCLTVAVRNAYARDWLEDRLSSTASRLLVGILNQADTKVQFVVGKPVA